jgi:hypothetical protein
MANEYKLGSKLVLLNGHALKLATAASDPGSPVAGDMYFSTALEAIRIYNGTAWQSVSSGAASTDFADDTFRIQDNGDATKEIAFQASGIATGTVRTVTMPDADVDLGALTNSNISASAAIARTKLASGTASHVLVNDGSGVMSSEAQLAASRGGLGTDASAFTGVLKASAGTFSASAIVNADIDAAAGIVYSKLSIADGDLSIAKTSGLQTALNGKLGTTLNSANIFVGNGSNVATGVAMSGEATIDNTGAITLDNAAVTGKVLTGFSSAAGTVAATDSILEAIEKLDGNIAALPSPMEYKGTWDADTNSPTLSDATGTVGELYRVTVAGTQDLDSGNITFNVGDMAVHNGTTWEKWDVIDAVVSVNGATGAVTVNAINQLTGDVTTSAASGSQSLAATIANNAVTTAKIAANAVDGTKIRLANNEFLRARDATDSFDLSVIKSNASGQTELGGVVVSDTAEDLGTDTKPWGKVHAEGLRLVDSGEFCEEYYIDAVSLTESATVTALSYAAASFVGAHVEYVIKTNAGEIRTGKVFLANKTGGTTSMSDQFSETADCEVVLSADFSTPNIRLRAANANAAAATMRLTVKLIRA